MAGPFVGAVVSVATDRNEISLRHPTSRGLPLALDRFRALTVVAEVLLKASRVKAQPSPRALSETCGTELLCVGVDPGSRDGIPSGDVGCGHPVRRRPARLAADDLGNPLRDPLDAVCIELNIAVRDSSAGGVVCHLHS